jgi:hypothetical protein
MMQVNAALGAAPDNVDAYAFCNSFWVSIRFMYSAYTLG